MHPVIQAAVRQGGGGADTVVVSATTTTPPVVVWAPGAPPAGFANRLLGGGGQELPVPLGEEVLDGAWRVAGDALHIAGHQLAAAGPVELEDAGRVRGLPVLP